MRQRFEQQLHADRIPIAEVKFPAKSRDELPPVLKTLQHIFLTPELNAKVFTLLEEKIGRQKMKRGRKGMDLWHILVLSVVRHCLDTNWDRLEHLANHDTLIRQVLGVHDLVMGDQLVTFHHQTLVDNVLLLDEQLLGQVNQLVVEAGHQLLKKKEDDDEALRLKTDSYVLETHVHFPTDLNLLWDSTRKCLDMIDKLREEMPLPGWRKSGYLCKELKRHYLAASRQVFRGKKPERKMQAVQAYVDKATDLVRRVDRLLEEPSRAESSPRALLAWLDLKRYRDYAAKLTDQVARRLLDEQTITASEKIFSIFEEHTEWINRGKLSKNVELGHRVLVTTDQHQLIVDYKVMVGEQDVDQIPGLLDRLSQNLKTHRLASHSFDKGFYSKANLALLKASAIERPVLPKKGRPSRQDKQTEGDPAFKTLRRAHNGIESNINMLEHHGLNRCMDKGLHGFRRCVGLSVLAFNLHVIGNALIAAEKKQKKKQNRARACRQRRAA